MSLAHAITTSVHLQEKSMRSYMRREVKVGGHPVGYVELVQLGELWKAVAFGAPPFPPPMFGQKGDAMGYVREFGKARSM